MNRKKAIRWLYSELADLVAANVISLDTADALRRHYGDIPPTMRKTHAALLIFGTLGAALIGLGIILIFAFNWDDLSRATKTVISFAPLIGGQFVGAWTLAKRRESVAWREGAATFLTIAFGATTGLISQVYHVGGDLKTFVLTWMLCTIPVAYLLEASTPVALYMIGIVSWAGMTRAAGGNAVGFWLLALAPAGHVVAALRRDFYSARSLALSWVYTLCCATAIGMTMGWTIPGLWIVVYSNLFAAMYLAGGIWFADAESSFRERPLHTVGTVGIVVTAMILSFEVTWRVVRWDAPRPTPHGDAWATATDYGCLTVVVAAALLLLALAHRHGKRSLLTYGSLSILATIAFSLAASGVEAKTIAIGFNIYLFACGIATVMAGIQRSRLSVMNGGLLLITFVITSRFFDSNLDIFAKGLVFIAVGVGFLTMNFVVARRLTQA